MRHLAEGWQVILGIATCGIRIPAVAVADRAPRRPWKGAAENYRRMRLLHRLRPGHDRVELHKLAVIFRLCLGPDRLHRFDLLAHLLHTRPKDGAVVLDLLLVPAAANAEQKAPARNLVERRDKLGGLDRVALDHQTDAGREFEPLGRTGRR